MGKAADRENVGVKISVMAMILTLRSPEQCINYMSLASLLNLVKHLRANLPSVYFQ